MINFLINGDPAFPAVPVLGAQTVAGAINPELNGLVIDWSDGAGKWKPNAILKYELAKFGLAMQLAYMNKLVADGKRNTTQYAQAELQLSGWQNAKAGAASEYESLKRQLAQVTNEIISTHNELNSLHWRSEDKNNDGIPDPGEDRNGDGKVHPEFSISDIAGTAFNEAEYIDRIPRGKIDELLYQKARLGGRPAALPEIQTI